MTGKILCQKCKAIDPAEFCDRPEMREHCPMFESDGVAPVADAPSRSVPLASPARRAHDAEIARSLGWRVSRDPWWNWHPGPHFDPPGDEWCIRRDGRSDLPCNEALPRFSEHTSLFAAHLASNSGANPMTNAYDGYMKEAYNPRNWPKQQSRPAGASVCATPANERAVSIGQDIINAQDRMSAAIGSFDYSGDGCKLPYRIRDYRLEDQTLFESDDRDARDAEWDRRVAEYVGLAALNALGGLLTASDALGKWLSAALDDPKVCDEMKSDIQAWFDAMPTPTTETDDG